MKQPEALIGRREKRARTASEISDAELRDALGVSPIGAFERLSLRQCERGQERRCRVKGVLELRLAQRRSQCFTRIVRRACGTSATDACTSLPVDATLLSASR